MRSRPKNKQYFVDETINEPTESDPNRIPWMMQCSSQRMDQDCLQARDSNGNCLSQYC